jgi:hypothetical protein
MINKKAISHVEVIISFVIFVSFVSFLFIIFNPFKFVSDTKVNLDITEKKIFDNITINMEVFSIKINSTIYPIIALEECFEIEDTRDINNFVMKNLSGKISNASKQGDNIRFENKGGFYRVYISEEITEHNFNSGSCKKINYTNYTLGVSKNYEVISNKSLYLFFENYELDYEKLKNNLGLKNEFYLQVIENSKDQKIILKALERYKPQGIEIMARSIPIEILDEKGNLNPAIINIQVWE